MGLKPSDSSASGPRHDGKSHVNHKGLHWLMAAVFVVGDMAGGGVLALPNALVSTGLAVGIGIISVCSVATAYTGLQLSFNWKMMQERWSEYREECRRPYGEMAFRAVGPKMRTAVTVAMCATQFGFATVLVLLASKNVSILLHFFFSIDISMCYVILLVALLIWPATMLKSPMHFWQVALFSAGSSTFFVILLLIGMSHDAPVCAKEVAYNDFDLIKFFMAYGTIIFAFGGHSAFPTIQHDMLKPAHFSKSILLAYTLITIYYLSVSIMGYEVYGGSVGDAVIPSIQLMWLQQTANILIAIHVITTVVIVFSPLVQEVEQLLHVPHHFGWKRFVVRSILFWLVIFVALSVPQFGPLMDLIGASTMSLMTMILPAVFYLSLRASTEKRRRRLASGDAKPGEEDDDRVTVKEIFETTPKTILIANIALLSFGIIGGTIATVSSLIKLTDSTMSAPCYVQYFTNGLPFSSGNVGMVNCCGRFRNTTVGNISADGFCSVAKI
ncbi:unnamed protein product [Caenorhabditis auriculariae]|uniref:Amino acid transporter transmembrane domain-containing protein n=1 Tax=Caenorhabditis auriculariae TaxID=2777116 RepID=A0A8S1GXQ9_9PELO|nr:unnamed protein product [Caenorhabditis auriculariae]